jgi:hypothetical protein
MLYNFNFATIRIKKFDHYMPWILVRIRLLSRDRFSPKIDGYAVGQLQLKAPLTQISI